MQTKTCSGLQKKHCSENLCLTIIRSDYNIIMFLQQKKFYKEMNMRGKLAKTLHAVARLRTVGMPDVEYYLTKRHLIKVTEFEKPIMCGTIVLSENCTSAVYKNLKKGSKK